MAMDVLFLMTRPSQRGEELTRELSSVVPTEKFEALYDVAALAERLRKLRGPNSIAIIYDPANSDLRKLSSLKDLFREGRTLLVLPDQEEETITLAHSLLPAFVTYVDDGNAQVVSVLKKLASLPGPGYEQAPGKSRH